MYYGINNTRQNHCQKRRTEVCKIPSSLVFIGPILKEIEHSKSSKFTEKYIEDIRQFIHFSVNCKVWNGCILFGTDLIDTKLGDLAMLLMLFWLCTSCVDNLIIHWLLTSLPRCKFFGQATEGKKILKFLNQNGISTHWLSSISLN